MYIEKKYYPRYPLNQCVDMIWVGTAPELKTSSSHHAALFTELIFNYGDTFILDGQNVENIHSRFDHQILSGLKTEPFQVSVSGKYNNAGLILKPYCYGMLYNKFGSKIFDQVSEIIFEQFFATLDPDLDKLERDLFKAFGNPSIDLDFKKFEYHLAKSFVQKGSLKQFSDSISSSQKSFIQKFKTHYHITPSEYIRLKQVNYAIQMLQDSKSKKLIHIGLDSGFYDQSHFIRVFKKHCGVTPKQFLQG
ncbi:helix-turn-helix transcriptional regulator [Reichenbachiella versicolor]|uniref:helix-turn-helix transcriptional regulator n=1 Tax=Reichenbachiella versicolor TaxID=1821036 RepID=UPI000D6E815E|nr:helix-turn-helix transcriptional regulator [Reichenbachiella versicolor]